MQRTNQKTSRGIKPSDPVDVVKERPIIDEHGYELQKKVMRRLIEKENSA